jgi:hypothetical protein
VSGLSIRVDADREVDARSAVEAVVSIFGGTDDTTAGSNYVATREWRADWWSDSWADVESERMVLHGTGWGDNLAVRSGIDGPALADDPLGLRLPHTIYSSLAGRAGVVVACVFVAIPLVTLARTYRRRAGDAHAPLAVEVARAGLTAGTVSAMADIYFESPQGGILLWSLIGLLWWIASPAMRSDPIDLTASAAAGDASTTQPRRPPLSRDDGSVGYARAQPSRAGR